MSKRTWYEVGDKAMQMAARAELEIEYYRENGDEDNAIAYWAELRDKHLDWFAGWIYYEDGEKNPMSDCYLTALEFVNEAKRYIRN